jgi:prepilin-type N-terminal cleavage/methylation domain-containing protein
MRSPGCHGFSLVEVLIGATILVIAMLGGFSAHIAADKLTRESAEKEIARGILESAMQRVLHEGAAELASGDSYVPGEAIAVPETTLLEDAQLRLETPGFVLGDPVPTVLTVRLVLAWTADSGIARSLSLTSATR